MLPHGPGTSCTGRTPTATCLQPPIRRLHRAGEQPASLSGSSPCPHLFLLSHRHPILRPPAHLHRARLRPIHPYHLQLQPTHLCPVQPQPTHLRRCQPQPCRHHPRPPSRGLWPTSLPRPPRQRPASRWTYNEAGQFTMEAYVTWQARDGEPAHLKESLALKVVDPVEGETEVTLHATQTEIKVGQPVRLNLSAINSIAKPPMTLTLTIKAPSGWSPTGAGFASACGPQCVATYHLESGQLKDIDVEMVPNQPGQLSLERLQEIEDRAIIQALEMQRQVGIEVFSGPRQHADTRRAEKKAGTCGRYGRQSLGVEPEYGHRVWNSGHG